MSKHSKRSMLSSLKSILKILKGSLHFRFAIFLVGAGTTLLVGLPLIHVIILDVFEIAADKIGYEIDPFWDSVSKVVGVLLVLSGVIVFLRGQKVAEKAPGSFDVSIPVGWGFEAAASKIARGRVVQFQKFNDDELDQELVSSEFIVDDVLEALESLGQFAVSNSFPAYCVTESGSTIVIRKTSGE